MDKIKRFGQGGFVTTLALALASLSTLAEAKEPHYSENKIIKNGADYTDKNGKLPNWVKARRTMAILQLMSHFRDMLSAANPKPNTVINFSINFKPVYDKKADCWLLNWCMNTGKLQCIYNLQASTEDVLQSTQQLYKPIAKLAPVPPHSLWEQHVSLARPTK